MIPAMQNPRTWYQHSRNGRKRQYNVEKGRTASRMDGNHDSVVQSSPDVVVGVVSSCSSAEQCSGQHTGSLPNMWYVPSVSPSLKTGLPSIGTRHCQAMFWWEDVHQAVVIHELRSRPRWFLSPDATSHRPSVSANRTDGDSGYRQHGNYPSVPPMGLV